jgi:hypothetical protein
MTRDELSTVVQFLDQVKAYIRKTADANMENGAAIIQNAGVSVKKPAARAPLTSGSTAPTAARRGCRRPSRCRRRRSSRG